METHTNFFFDAEESSRFHSSTHGHGPAKRKGKESRIHNQQTYGQIFVSVFVTKKEQMQREDMSVITDGSSLNFIDASIASDMLEEYMCLPCLNQN